MTSVIVDPADATHAYASYGGFREGYTSANVYESSADADGIVTWENVSGNLPNAPVNFLAYDRGADVVYAATDLGVFFMAGDTKKWKKLGDNLPNTATEDLKLQASSGSIYVGTFGRGTWRIPQIPGTPRYSAAVVAGIDDLSDAVTGMNLDAGTTKHLLHSVGEIREKVLAGENQCKKLDALGKQIAAFVPRKLTAAQGDQLNAEIDSIKAQVPC